MPRRTFSGVVVSDKSDKTIVVRVEHSVLHSIYGKRVRRHHKYHVHDETNSHKIGDVVHILESKPISRLKRWVVVPSCREGV
ncbi:MAG: 30S ribosomal protein S17 [Holosporales bacterium]|jgi:small subunit ribosomal protein S17|nr:30S ribosomal protein S17 [Holosporales bacterium]